MTAFLRPPVIALLLLGLHQGPPQQAPPPPPPPPPTEQPSQPTAPRPAPAVLTGRVLAADTGLPLRSAEIRLALADSIPATTAATSTLVSRTDQDGRFELQSVPAGSYLLMAGKAGFVPTAFTLPGAPPGTTFGLTAGQRVDLGDLKLPRGGVIAGRILDSNGEPVVEGVVTAERVSFLTPAVRRVIRARTAQTNDLGDYRVHGLSPGKYYVSVRAANAGPGNVPVFYPGVSSIAEAMPIEVRAGQDSAGIAMQLAPAAFGTVSGIVLDSKGAPFASANAWLVSSRTDGVQVDSAALSAVTNAAGRFVIGSVTPGEYRLEVFSVAWLEKVAHGGEGAGPPPELASVPVSITSGATIDVNVRTSAGFRVRGQVFVDGAPLTAESAVGVRVAATAPWASNLSGSSVPVIDGVSPDGTFQLTGVQGLRLLATRPSVTGTSYHHTSVGGADVSERGIEVSADISGIEIHLTTRPTRLEGTLVDAAGASVGGATILVFSTNRTDWLMPGSRRYRDVKVTGQGKFTAAGMPAGNYLAALVANEDADRWADPDYLDSLRVRGTAFTLNDGSTTSITLTVKR